LTPNQINLPTNTANLYSYSDFYSLALTYQYKSHIIEFRIEVDRIK
jgi:hypothetical protein